MFLRLRPFPIPTATAQYSAVAAVATVSATAPVAAVVLPAAVSAVLPGKQSIIAGERLHRRRRGLVLCGMWKGRMWRNSYLRERERGGESACEKARELAVMLSPSHQYS